MVVRGLVEDSRKAGPAKEAAFASACLFDKWSQDVLDCIGAIASADVEQHLEQSTKCLALLSPAQRDALDTKMVAWTTTYENESWTTAEDERIANLPPEIPCGTIITVSNVGSLAPALAQAGEELIFATLMRRHGVVAACEQWSPEVRGCVQMGGSLTTCRGRLDAAQEQLLATKLATINVVMAKIAVAKARPAATYECKAMVAAHYSDAAWRGKAEPTKDPKATRAELTKQAAERKAMIAESRRLMLDACLKETWSPTLRACEVVESDETCSGGMVRRFVRWGFPAFGAAKTGVPECDAYGQTMQVLLMCNQFPQASKTAVKQAYEQLVQSLVTNPATARAAATSCKQGDDGLKQALAAMNCMP